MTLRTLFNKVFAGRTSRASSGQENQDSQRYLYAFRQKTARDLRLQLGQPLADRDTHPEAQVFFDTVIREGDKKYFGIDLESEDPDIERKIAARNRYIVGLPPGATEERFQAAWQNFIDKIMRER